MCKHLLRNPIWLICFIIRQPVFSTYRLFMFTHYASRNNGHTAKCPEATDWHKTQLPGDHLIFLQPWCTNVQLDENTPSTGGERPCSLAIYKLVMPRHLLYHASHWGVGLQCSTELHHNNEVSSSSLLLSSLEIMSKTGCVFKMILFPKDE